MNKSSWHSWSKSKYEEIWTNLPNMVKYCPTLSNQFKGTLYHCAGTVQPVKSFKIRGALNAIMHLSRAQKKKGVIWSPFFVRCF